MASRSVLINESFRVKPGIALNGPVRTGQRPTPCPPGTANRGQSVGVGTGMGNQLVKTPQLVTVLDA